MLFFHSNLQSPLNLWIKEKLPVLSPIFQGILALWNHTFTLPESIYSLPVSTF